jgi:nucleoside triphosphate diphosphatase
VRRGVTAPVLANFAVVIDPQTITNVQQLMAALRDPIHGCPWDQAQDWSSLTPYLLEEAYEVCEAIEQRNEQAIQEELGDLLFQIAFLAAIGSERGIFDMASIEATIIEKMVRRHPHVFADATVNSIAAQTTAWETIKGKEKAGSREVALALPALVRAAKLQRRITRQRGESQVDPRQSAAALLAKSEIDENVIGDLLYAIVAIAQLHGIDSETALRKVNSGVEERLNRTISQSAND